MLVWFISFLEENLKFLQFFNYITVRSFLAISFSFIFTIYFGKRFIAKLRFYQIGQFVRDDGPKSHMQKSGTPTMGGILILFAILLSLLLFANLSNRFVLISILTLILFGFVGFIDDYLKLIVKNSKGLTFKQKLLGQFVAGFIVSVVLFLTKTSPSNINYILPFFKNISIDLGIFFIVFSCIYLVGFSNAVNLTDGLDGLVSVPVMMASFSLGILVYLAGHIEFANYLYIPYVQGSGEMAILAVSIIGACCGFLWFNIYPAQVFMGDVGSLALGALLALLAIICRMEIVFVVIGGLFVIETLSVILQVGLFKKTKKRIFKMAPIHHHFELKGWSEQQVVVRFWIMSMIFTILGLISIKLR